MAVACPKTRREYRAERGFGQGLLSFGLFPPRSQFDHSLSVVGRRCCAQALSSGGERGLLFITVPGLLVAVASLVGSMARGILPEQDWNPPSLHWQATPNHWTPRESSQFLHRVRGEGPCRLEKTWGDPADRTCSTWSYGGFAVCFCVRTASLCSSPAAWLC